MARLRHLWILIVALLSTSAWAAETPPRHFEPTGPWAMEYAENACRLIRNFSDGKTELTLAFERFGLGPQMQLGIAGQDIDFPSRRQGPELRYGGQAESRHARVTRTSLADGRASYLLRGAALSLTVKKDGADGDEVPPWPSFDYLADERAAASTISSVTLSQGKRAPLEIAFGPLSAPILAMQQCARDLVQSWDIDVPRLLNASRPVRPVTDPIQWVVPDDYPSSESTTGYVGVRLIVSPEGVVEKCLTEVLNKGAFDDAVCFNVKRRAVFKPALDADGQPMRSYWTQNWAFMGR